MGASEAVEMKGALLPPLGIEGNAKLSISSVLMFSTKVMSRNVRITFKTSFIYFSSGRGQKS